ncbi:MAG: CehA/McbA family metallohydrolase [Halanaerobiales bacterium]
MKKILVNWCNQGGDIINIRDEWEIKKKFKAEDTGDLNKIPFYIPDRIKQIIIEFSFSPEKADDKTSEDIIRKELKNNEQLKRVVAESKIKREELKKEVLPFRNHINFILFDSRGRFRGRWDHPAHFGKKIVISRNLAETSAGFVSGSLPRGQWKVVIENQNIITEKISINLKITVWGECEYKNSYGGELHVHSENSDGNLTPAKIQKIADNNDLDYIALTDHNNISGWISDRTIQSPVLVPGLELSTFDGHALVLDIKSYINWHGLYTGELKSIKDIIEIINNQNGLFGISHPFEFGSPLCVGCRWNFIDIPWEKIDFIEIWNRNWSDNKIKNNKSYSLWQKKLNEGHNLTAIASNDVHDFSRYNQDNSYPLTYILAKRGNKEELITSLWEGRVYLSSGPTINLSLYPQKEEKEKYGIGDIIESTNTNWVVDLKINGLMESAKIILKGNQGILKAEKINKKRSITFSISSKGLKYFLAEIISDDGEKVLITNPVYFT